MVKKMSNKLFLITTNNKRFEEWVKQNRIKLMKMKNKAALDHFNQGYSDVRTGNYLARASYVCYWEIFSNGSLAKISPAMTQATLIHMMHRFIEMEKYEEVDVINQMMINFLRLLGSLDSPKKEGEPSEQE